MANPKRLRNRRVIGPEPLEPRRVLATLAGTVYEDQNNNEVLDADDPRLAGVMVYLDANRNGLFDQPGFRLDPDQFAVGQVLNHASTEVLVSATDSDQQSSFRVLASKDPSLATTGQRVFGLEHTTHWDHERQLRFDFASPANEVALDVVGTSEASPHVILEAFNEQGQLVQNITIHDLNLGTVHELSISRPQNDISFAIARVTTETATVAFDNLRVNDAGGERATLTSETGDYRFSNVPPGLTVVAQIAPAAYTLSVPTDHHWIDVISDVDPTNLDFAYRTGAIQGLVYQDLDLSGPYQPTRDRKLVGAGVYLDRNQNGVADITHVAVLPAEFADGQVLEFVSPRVTLSTVDANNRSTTEKVVARASAPLSLGEMVFAHEADTAWSTDHRLRATLNELAQRVEVTFQGIGVSGQIGRLVAYATTGEELASVETLPLAEGESEVLSIVRDSLDIHHAVAYTSGPGEAPGSLQLTDFRALVVDEPVAITRSDGEYQFKPLSAGNYELRLLPLDEAFPSYPEARVHQVSVVAGETHAEVDFGAVPSNFPPLAKNDFQQTQEDLPATIQVLANDRDPDGLLDATSVVITQPPANGTAEVDAAGRLHYTPDADFHGRDTLLYTVLDEQGAVSNSAIVTIQVDPVNDAPRTADDSVSVLGSLATPIPVLSNDTDVDSSLASNTIKVLRDPTSGTVTVDATTGIVTYTPLLPATTDSFTYTVEDSDGWLSNEATVTLHRFSEGVIPTAVDDTAATLEGTPVLVTVTDNDSDFDGVIQVDSMFIVAFPQHGSASVEANGQVIYRPHLGFVGTDVFSYRVLDDGGFVSNAANVRITTSERDFPYQNPIQSHDVDSNGFVSPRDVLLIIREIENRSVSSSESGEIIVNPTSGNQPSAYFDVDGDGFIVARDVLAVVLRLNELSRASAEPPEIELPSIHAAAAAAVFALLDAADDEDGWLL